MQTAPLDMRQRHGADALSRAAARRRLLVLPRPGRAAAAVLPDLRRGAAAGAADHFDRLGLPRAFDLDPTGSSAATSTRQRQLHPDRFATRTPRERAFSQIQAVSLNEAYETLKDPSRAPST